jgi:FkbM family methyltransferase
VVVLRNQFKKLLKRFGYEVHGPLGAFLAERSLRSLLLQERVNLVIDVGANTGQFATDLRSSGYSGRIESFEPLARAHSELLRCASADPGWKVAERMAIGAAKGSVNINVAGNSVSSSVLEMLPSHAAAEPQSTYVGTENVPVNRLDDVCLCSATDRILLKMDVQGYEKQVLDGAPMVLGKCRAVLTEMSLIPLYDGQVLAFELWSLLIAIGFEPWAFEPGFRHPHTGRMLQLDGVFVRRG